MASIAPNPDDELPRPFFSRARLILLGVLLALLTLCLVFAWTTRGAMANLSFLREQGSVSNATGGKKTLVDLRPWQTAQALAPLAVSAEETEFAHETERLADHEVDQAFASALRMAGLQAQHYTPAGEALALSQKVAQLEQLINADQAQVDSLMAKAGSQKSPAKSGAEPGGSEDDLEVAKAQLGLDSDELADAQRDLERASGNESGRVQSELAAHEASMKQLGNQPQGDRQVAVLSAAQHRTLAARLNAWFKQRDRYRLIEQAQQQAGNDVAALTAEHNALEANANAGAAAQHGILSDRATRLADIKARSAERQILSIYDDRIQTQQQLATVYGKWAAQVLLQHEIVLHLILQSLALIVFILIAMLFGDALVRRLMAHPALDRRQMHTLRGVVESGIQVLGAVLILLVIFGTPQQTPTILGLGTAALTIALQDFIVAFLGWFVLVGKNGIHVGDWVEINGVGGVVTEVGLFSTTMLETGTLADKGHPTGRRITFLNSFAIRGQFFNFTTTGQWMWDEITVNMPASEDIHAVVERIDAAVRAETEENTRIAEQEWKRGTGKDDFGRFSASLAVNLRPSATSIDIVVRYVTRASERFEMRNRLNQRVVELLREQPKPERTEDIQGVENAQPPAAH
jgi:small-conductance mechanosensitive channel